MTVLRSRSHRWATQGMIPLVATVWLLAALAAVGLTGGARAGASPLAAKAPPAGPLLTWSTVPATVHPPPLAYASEVYDSDTGTVVLFGGVEANGTVSDDTWVWNGASWTDYPGSQIEAPPAREMASMAFDPQQHQLILFGGQGTGGQLLGDTWAWNGASWYQLSPPDSPPPRDAAAMAYAGSGKLVLFGGTGDAGPGPAATPAAPVPTPSTSSVASTTSTAATPVVLNDTWLWTGANWVASTATGPSARSGAAVSYDAARHDAVLFGGETSPAGSTSPRLVADTWTWDGSAWKRVTPHASPSARDGAAVADDPDAGGVVLQGGSGASGPLSDTWVWSGTNWIKPRTSGSPSPRAGAAAAYGAVGPQLILFGGAGSGGPLGDTIAMTTSQSSGANAGSASGSAAATTAPSSTSPPANTGSSYRATGKRAPTTTGRTTPRSPAPLSTTSTVVHREQSVTLSGSGFAPGTRVEITFHSTPEVVGYASADAFGYFKTTVSVPDTAAQGTHHFEATGERKAGGTDRLVVAVKVVGPAGHSSPTTDQTLIMVMVALLLPLAAWLTMSGADRMRSRNRRKGESERLAL